MSQTYGEKRSEKEKAIDSAVLERVKAGIIRLERAHGPNWVEKFGGMKDFDITNGDKCVLGRVYGDYEDGLDALGIREDYGISLGFSAGLPDDDHEDAWAVLQEAWEQELTKLGVK